MTPGRTLSRHPVVALVVPLVLVVVAAGCGSDEPTASGTTDTTVAAVTSETTATDLTSGFELASWGEGVTVTIENGSLHFVSNGLPDHERQAEYALPDQGVMVPDASTASAGADPTVEQSYDYVIPMTPVFDETKPDTSLGVIGVMISGAALFNPYEGDGATVATQSNFSVLNDAGEEVWFLDDCAGHPTPMGQYHYHALPKCVTATVDEADGPSHIIGIAFDGFPIYGDRDIDGNQLTADDLDECNGITSPTPEFPEGVYHYVLLDVADGASSIRCFSGVVDAGLMANANMAPAGPPPDAAVGGDVVTFTAEVWADNWFSLYVNGQLVGEDSVPITTERSFNAETITFESTYPLTVAMVSKDFKETDSGLEYIGTDRQQMGDGGLIVQITDTASGAVVATTTADWRALVIHTAPTNPDCESSDDPDTECQSIILDEPSGWTEPTFDDSAWTSATVYSADEVGAKDGYTEVAWDPAAAIVWTGSLTQDNTILWRTTVSAP